MLREEFGDPAVTPPAELRDRYERRLAERIDAAGVGTVAEETGIDRETLAAIAAGESREITLERAAAILATDPDLPTADAIVADALDVLLLGMSTAVLDVEAIRTGLDGDMETKEIQQKVEGRLPMTLEEYARLRAFIERRKR